MSWKETADRAVAYLFSGAMILGLGAALLWMYPSLIRAIDDHRRVGQWEQSVAGHNCKALKIRLNNGGSIDAAMDDAVLRMYCNTNVWMEEK